MSRTPPHSSPEEILERALRLAPAERAAFVRGACAGDQALQAELLDLLQVSERFPELLRLPPAPPEQARSRIGRYPILGEIGRGGMGVVYLAEDQSLGRQIAIKTLPEALSRDRALRGLLLKEARLLAALNHPGIATIHSLEEAEGESFLTMEHLEGETLADRLDRGPLSLENSLEIGRQIAGALQAAHGKGIIHRDLKPENIVLTSGGTPKILDFGLAVHLGGDARSLEDGPDAAGTPGYMSPEQLRGDPVDARADLWAFGLILRECLAGRGQDPREATPPGVQRLLEACQKRPLDQRLAEASTARRILEEELNRLRHLGPSATPSAAEPPSNLRPPADRFIGRKREIGELLDLFQQTRIVTLTGPGGCGKTRLALEAARTLHSSLPDGIWLAELTSVQDPQRIAAAVRDALRLPPEAREDPSRLLAEYLRERRLLLILDNCEHLLPGCAEFLDDLRAATNAPLFLATSQEPLHLAEERVLHLAPLTAPRADRRYSREEAEALESLSLLVDRVLRRRPSFRVNERNLEALLQICRLVEGLPLALELAAARLVNWGPAEVASRLRESFALLSDRERRRKSHRTLGALLDWSYGLLSPEGCRLFRFLSIFPAGWTLDTVESVAEAAGIEEWAVFEVHDGLLSKSLIEVDPLGPENEEKTRFRMLETIRRDARGKLAAASEEEAARRRLLAHSLRLAERSEPALIGSGQSGQLALLRREQENLRLALDTCELLPDLAEDGLRLAACLGRFWLLQGHWKEGLDRTRRLLEKPGDAAPPEVRGRALHWAANLAEAGGEWDLAERLALESVRIWREMGRDSDVARLLNNLGNLANRRGDFPRAAELYEEALAVHRARAEKADIAHSLNNLGTVQARMGRLDQARASLEESLACKKELGDQAGAAGTLQNLGALAGIQEDFAGAAGYLKEAERIHRNLGNRLFLAVVLGNLGLLDRLQGSYQAARERIWESISLRVEAGDTAGIPSCLEVLAMTAVEEARPEVAARLLGFTEAQPSPKGGSSPLEDREELLKALERIRSCLDDQSFADAWAAGQGMTAEEAVAVAERFCRFPAKRG